MLEEEKIVILGLWIAFFVVFVDQISKYLMLNNVLAERSVIEIFPCFNLVKAWNTGVSFSMFNNGGMLGIIGLSALALLIVAFLLKWLYGESNRLIQVALGFIIGGAIGNVIDRIYHGAVFDFLDFYWRDAHWPAFNMADSFICIGAMIIICNSLFESSKKTEKGENK